MFQTNMVQSLLKGLDPIHQKSLTLTPGQIFSGKIIKLYPGQLASLQLGGVSLTAKLEAALTTGNRYWFKVQPSEGIPVLKVLEGTRQNEVTDKGSATVLQQLGIANTKINEMIVNSFAKKELPFSKQQVQFGQETLKNVGMVNERGLSILQMMVQRNLPITPTSFLAIQSVVEGRGLSENLHQLSSLLQQLNSKDPDLIHLKQLLLKINGNANINIDQQHSQINLSNQLSALIKQIGFQYERDVLSFIDQQGSNSEKILLQLKSLLIKVNQLQLPQSIQEKVELLLNRITGQQLISLNQESPISNYALMVPLKMLGIETDLTIQWEGKKQKNGKLDPNHCRILFYINLQTLKETIVDVQIQNRVVSVHVLNDHQKPVTLIQQFQPLLGKALNEQNFLLSSVKWTKTDSQKRNVQKRSVVKHSNEYYQRPYQGVDIRI